MSPLRPTNSSGQPTLGCTCLNIRKAARAVTQFYDHALRPSGLRATQFSVLVGVRRSGPLTLTQLAEKLAMEQSTLTRNLRPLTREGLLQTAPGGDRRTREVKITEKGERRLKLALPLWRAVQGEMAARMGGHGLALLHDALAGAFNSAPGAS